MGFLAEKGCRDYLADFLLASPVRLKQSGLPKFLLLVAPCLVAWRYFHAETFTANNVILAFTAAVIVWYTVEANRLAQLTKKQIEIEIRPIMTITQNPPDLRIQNIGRSPALGIRIQPLERGQVKLEFPERLLCLPNDGYGLRPAVYRNGQHISGSEEAERIWRQALTCQGDDRYEILISYHDVEGDEWESRDAIDKSGVSSHKVNRAKG